MSVLRRILRLGAKWVESIPQAAPDEAPAGPLGAVRGLWIAWETQRRTTELAACLNVPLERLSYRGPTVLRYPVLIGHSLALVSETRPDVLIVQNPSIILAVGAIIARAMFGCRVVVDRHTNFMLNKPSSLRKALFTAISRFTLRYTDLTIVTNRYLVEIVSEAGGRGQELPDRIPSIPQGTADPGRENVSICFICTYAADEPWREVVKASAALPGNATISMTGNPDKVQWPDDLLEIRNNSEQLVVTGFLPDAEYEELLATADIVMDLTTFDHCLVCGAYEGIAAGSALVLSDKLVNRELFGDVPIYVLPTADSIAQGLTAAIRDVDAMRRRTQAFRPRFERSWQERFDQTCSRIVDLARGA